MKKATIIVLGLGLCQSSTARAESNEQWPGLERAFKADAFLEVLPKRARDWVLRDTGAGCPRTPVGDFRGYSITVRFDRSRTLKVDMLVGRLPSGYDAYAPIVAAAKGSPENPDLDGCLLPKSGVSLLQVERFWFVFPTVCSEQDPYKKSLPLVIRALQKFWGSRFPKNFIHAPCGTMFPRLLDIEQYLTSAEKPPVYHRAAQHGVAPDGRSPAAPARR